MPGFRIHPILTPPLAQTQPTGQKKQDTGAAGSSFDAILNQVSDETSVKFSKHAQARLESRNITLDDNDLKKLGGAVDEASQKGVQDSLVVMNGLAFIVSVPDRTVVTAMPMNEAGSKVFTNIDGAVIA